MTTPDRLLFTPFRLGNLTLRNRIVFSAHLTNYAVDCMPSERQMAYYRERAKGGVGLIITEEQSVHPTDHPYEKIILAFYPTVIPIYKRITEEVHLHGARILAQINHNGGQGTGMYTRLPLWAPSSIADPMFREVPKAMEREDIQQVIQGFAQVARYTQQGNFDGVELQCSHSSLVRQFLSKRTNLRTDAYGGPLLNRLRVLREIIAAIRTAVGREYVMGVRICGDELIRDGILLEEAVETARILEADGLIDYINTSVGTATETLFMIEGSMHVPPGYALYISSALRKAIKLPVIGVGRIKDPIQAEHILQEGHADLIGIVRGQISDPAFAKKSREYRNDDIRLCISCNQECVGRMGLNRWMGCIQTPATGREQEWGMGMLKPTRKTKRVIIVGGGPAGLKAASIAAQRGHHVTLFEKESALGGQINIAVRVNNRAELGDLIRNMLHEISDLELDLRTGIVATCDEILGCQPDAVVIATGSQPNPTPFPGADAEHVVDHRKVLTSQVQFGKRVVIVDQLSDHRATSVAEFLAERGCEVEILSPALYVGQELGVTLDLETWQRRASQLGILRTPNVSVLSVEGRSINAIHNYSGDMIQRGNIDTVVLAVPALANDQLYFELKGKVPELHRIGDCLAPRRAHAAIIEGERVGRLL